MEINLGPADRMTRLVLGTTLLYAALVLSNGWGVLLVGVAGIALVSGATGRCLIYRMLGLSTAPPSTRSTRSGVRVEGLPRDHSGNSPDDLVEAVRKAMGAGRIQRLTIRDGDWTVIDIPLTIARSGALEVPLLEFLRARAEVAGYYQLTVRH